MRPFLLRSARALALTLALAGTGRAGPQGPVAYELFDQSNLTWGCMGPCACPVIFIGPLKGGFTLVQTDVDPLFTYYDVRDIAWRYVVPGTNRIVHVTGSGTYQLGGEVALTQRLQLDIVSDGSLEQHLDSGFVPARATFPAIDVEVHVNVNSCLDSALRVVAAPASTTVGSRAPVVRLAATPNPTRSGVEITVALATAGRARVEVLDVHGRALATLADGLLPEGDTRLAWDGRTRAGGDAGVGVFWVRASMGAHAATQRIVRFR
jgi:hypothetical protein